MNLDDFLKTITKLKKFSNISFFFFSCVLISHLNYQTNKIKRNAEYAEEKISSQNFFPSWKNKFSKIFSEKIIQDVIFLTQHIFLLYQKLKILSFSKKKKNSIETWEASKKCFFFFNAKQKYKIKEQKKNFW